MDDYISDYVQEVSRYVNRDNNISYLENIKNDIFGNKGNIVENNRSNQIIHNNNSIYRRLFDDNYHDIF